MQYSDKQRTWRSTDTIMLGAVFGKLRSLSLREIVRRLVPQRLNVAFYKARPDAFEQKLLAKVQVQIERTDTASVLTYKALVDGKVVHQSLVHGFSLRPVQFGFGVKPVIVNCATLPEYRGLHIYPHVLSYILHDLQTMPSMEEVFIWADVNNRSSLRAIERAGFEFVAYCRGTRVGPFMFGRKVDCRREGLSDTNK